MEIWIIRDGEKVGPIHDYELRRKIQDGELTRETMGWHEGLATWRPLGEISLFKDEFNWVQLGDTGAGQSIEDEHRAIVASLRPPPLPTPPVLWRRFWARWMDLHVYIAIWWLAVWASGRDVEAVMSSLWLMVVQLVPWFILEAILIHRLGTTPGKWLLGLRVINADGSALGLTAAMMRSLRILVGGIGFGWSLLALFCQTLSFFTCKRLGNTLWDHAGGHRVQAEPLVAWRIITVIAVFFFSLQLQMAVISPYVIKSAVNIFPALKEELEKNPPWHLPEKQR